jgi:S1-C subfamily serine protease
MGGLVAWSLGAAVVARAADDGAQDARSSVVEIACTCRYPDLHQPWQKRPAEKVSGTGVVIEGGRILTNAHVVEYATEVTIQPVGSGKKWPAVVAAAAPAIDLAVLAPADVTALKGRRPLTLASRPPKLRDAVSVYGFPIGGTGISITKGIISRIEYAEYDHGVHGLQLQIDAALNAGNSGGPVMAESAMVGVAYAVQENAENVGYVIPAEEIALFLADVADGRYEGKPGLHDELQPLENAALRERLGLPDSLTGVFVSVPASKRADYPLRRRDVITHVDGLPIDNDGAVTLSEELRLSFRYVVARRAKEGKIRLTVWRGGKSLDVLTPAPPEPDYVIRSLQGKYPSYFVFGPLALTAATKEYVDSLTAPSPSKSPTAKGEEMQPLDDLIGRGSPLLARYTDQPAFPGEEIVAVAALLPHKLSQGYEEAATLVLSHVNDAPVKNLRHAAELIRDCQQRFVEFRFADRFAETLVFDRSAAEAALEEILADNDIRSAFSADLRDVGKGAKGGTARPGSGP